MIIRPTASLLVCSSRNAVRSEQLLETFLSRISAATRGFSSQHGAIPMRSKRIAQQHHFKSCNTGQRRYATKSSKVSKINKIAKLAPEAHPKTPLSKDIPTKFEELPKDYTDEAGLPYTPILPSQEVVDHIFGQGFSVDAAHHIFAVLHGRRVAGTLDDPSLPAPVEGLTTTQYLTALNYLRQHIAVNEILSAGKRAELDLAQMEQEAIARGEEVGLYKPEVHVNQTGIKLPSALENIRELKRLEWEAKAQELEAKKAAELAKYKDTPAGQLAVFDERGVELRRPGENKKLQAYIDAMEADAPKEVPEMSALTRLLPSALVCLLVLGGCALYVSVYVPPAAKDRLWPDIPRAAATVLPIIGFNFLVFLLWKHPPAWKMLNRHFLVLPGYPRAFAVLGNAFSHQEFTHLAVNMAMLFFIGTRLADDIGRAPFLALYFSSATMGSMAGLTLHVLAKNFHVSSLGASTAVYGLAAAYFWLHWNEGFRLFGILPPEPLPAMAGWAALAMMIGKDVWALRKGVVASVKTGSAVDHAGHLGGVLTGITGMQIYMRKEKERRERMQKKVFAGWLGKN